MAKDILLISGNSFSVFGGYERVIHDLIVEFKKGFMVNVRILSLPHYRTLLCDDIVKNFDGFEILRDSEYKNRYDYVKKLVMRRLSGDRILLNYHVLEKYEKIIHGADAILVTDPLLITPVKLFLGRSGLNKKVIYWDHGSLLGYLAQSLTSFFYKDEIILGIKQADACLAISSSIKELVEKINPNMRVFLVFNPVRPASGELIRRSEKNIFLYIGRLSDRDKNISFLLRGLSKLSTRDWVLLVFGSGKDEAKLKKLADKLKISQNVEWLGFKEEPFAYLREAKALVLTSRWEGFPLVLVEANQRGIPFISSNCGGPKDIIIEGTNGVLYEKDNMADFVRVMGDVISGKITFPDQEKIVETTRRFEETVVIRNIYDAIREVLEEGGI